MTRHPFKLAVSNITTDSDPKVNRERICQAAKDASARGARLVLFAEGALSGYVKSQIQSWSNVDWIGLENELNLVKEYATEYGIHIALGCNQLFNLRLRPYNSLLIISDQGEVISSYHKRYLSHSEITDWYSPGKDPVCFEIDGWRFGSALCIEVNFPEIFSHYEALDVDCVLLATSSSDAVHWIQACGHAACNNLWIGLANAGQSSKELPGGLIGPNGLSLVRHEPNGDSELVIGVLDEEDPALDTALNKARPWRRKARDGSIYKVDCPIR